MRTLQYRTRFIELAAEVNAEMPRYVVSRVAEALNGARKAVNGSRILLLGVSYKKDVGDTRESPALDIIAYLRAMGAEVSFHDPYVGKLSLDTDSLESTALTAEAVVRADAVVVTSDHSGVDYDLVLEHASIIIDPRNALSGRTGKARVYPIAGPARTSTHGVTDETPPAGVAISPV